MAKAFIIAGEASGDALGGPLIKALRKKDPSIEIKGIGGQIMEETGAIKSLMAMSELSVMGIWEIIPKIPHLYRIYKGIIEEIEAFQPDVVITIDLPDFNFFVGRGVKKSKNVQARVIHYVAPTVWAWRPGRAESISRFLDGIICLFPFEPSYFTKYKLRATYAGHPITSVDIDSITSDGFREEYDVPEDSKLIGVLFGSRIRELEEHKGEIIKVVNFLHKRYPNLHLVIPTLPHMELDVMKILKHLPCTFSLVMDEKKKWQAFKACEAALAVSGTVGLELAYAGTPHIIGYKTSPVTWFVLRMLVQVKYAHLANLILNEGLVPECLQKDFEYEKIHDELVSLLEDEEARKKQIDGFARLRKAIYIKESELSSDRAASFILSLLK